MTPLRKAPPSLRQATHPCMMKIRCDIAFPIAIIMSRGSFMWGRGRGRGRLYILRTVFLYCLKNLPEGFAFLWNIATIIIPISENLS